MTEHLNFQEKALDALRRRTTGRPRFTADPDRLKIVWTPSPADEREIPANNNQHHLAAITAAEAALLTDGAHAIAEQLAELTATLADARDKLEYYGQQLINRLAAALDTDHPPTTTEGAEE